MTPPLQQARNRFCSAPLFFPEKKHPRSCDRQVKPFFCSNVPTQVAKAPNVGWQDCSVMRQGAFGCYGFRDLWRLIDRFFMDIFDALDLHKFSREEDCQLAGIAPSLVVIKNGHTPVGIIKMTTPPKDKDSLPLTSPTLLGDMFDYLCLVGCFYGCGPVCGILTNGEEWLICWLPRDDNHERRTQRILHTCWLCGKSSSDSEPRQLQRKANESPQ